MAVGDTLRTQVESWKSDQHADLLFRHTESLACINNTCSKRACSCTGVQTVMLSASHSLQAMLIRGLSRREPIGRQPGMHLGLVWRPCCLCLLCACQLRQGRSCRAQPQFLMGTQ